MRSVAFFLLGLAMGQAAFAVYDWATGNLAWRIMIGLAGASIVLSGATYGAYKLRRDRGVG